MLVLLKDALRLIETITKNGEHSGFFGRAISDVDDRREQEKVKEEELLATTGKYQQFAIDFGEGLISNVFDRAESVWHFRFGDLPLRLDGNNLSGTTEIERPESSLFLALRGSDSTSKPRANDLIRYSFSGVVIGRTCNFEIEEELIEPTWRQPDKKERKGYLVFDELMETAQVMEIKDDQWKSPYTIKRKQPNKTV